MPDAPLIELRNVTVRTDAGKLVLENISLTIHEGETVGCVFIHGPGKSTLLRVASGFFEPAAGEVLYRGRRYSDRSFAEETEVQSKIGFVFQAGGLLVNGSCFDNVALPLRYHTSLSEKEIEEKVMAALTEVGMSGAARTFAWELSVQRQKLVALARALVRDPEVILFDNFVTGTDIAAWEIVNRIVRQRRATSKTAWMLILEPDPGAYKIAHRLAIFEDAHLLGINEPEKMKTSSDMRVSRAFRSFQDFEVDT